MQAKSYNENIEALLNAAKSGDLSAQNKIVEENVGLVRAVVKRFLNRGHEAEDLFQIGSIGLIKAIDKFDLSFEVKFSTYAEVCIVNSMKSYAAKCSNKSYETVSLDDIGIDAPSQEKNPESIYVDKEFFSELWRIIDNELSDLERQVFIFFIQGDDYHQISAELGISEKSVDNALQRARGKIRKKFSGMMPLK